ncbi:DUF4233 domain-containing protein [Actinoplanes sp. NEAU-A12]|uniref:DUF4233 domain-containing protein n=1 Tax=Actinoplanes sandaracinus TaxID=3045177 RepID=A0ABT6WF05_9ACTN|nr:DUF4233 domain-containing protein [Actinoplanes sandaracinus]MDI6098301.1 DUF4233 domain-containing protein [Actinoplanes sandaracinus]
MTAPDENAMPSDGEQTAAPRPSGLKNPQAAVRGLGSGTLVLEAIVLLLTIQPILLLGGDLKSQGVTMAVIAAVLSVVLAGLMGKGWAWHVGTALQLVLIAGGFLHFALAAVGVIFGAAWAYALHVRRTILG